MHKKNYSCNKHTNFTLQYIYTLQYVYKSEIYIEQVFYSP